MEQLIREAKRVSLALFDTPDVLDGIDAILAIEILSFVNRRGSGLTAAHRGWLRAIVQLSHHEAATARAMMDDLANS